MPLHNFLMAQLDWKPVAASLMWHLQNNGATVTHVNDGGGWEKTPTHAEALDAATGVDTADLRVWLSKDSTCYLILVYGNEPEELVADWITRGAGPHTAIEDAITHFAEEWKDMPCPTTAD